jgi:DNA-binding NarL/FixJ family response regulator
MGLKELNEKYPERRRKAKTLIMDFREIETKEGGLTDLEKACLASITVDPSGEIRLMTDLRLMLDKFPKADKIIIEKRREGWTEQDIADFLNKNRRTIIRRLDTIFKKLVRTFLK